MKYRKQQTQTIHDALLSLLYPRRCPLCDRVVPPGEEVCPSCRAQIVYETEPRCMKCGRSVADDPDPARVYCRDCEAHPHVYDRGFPLLKYRSAARSIYRLKYSGRREYARWYGEEILREMGDSLRALRAEALVPVPLHPARYRKRGYNQAADLARVLSRGLGIPVRTDLIERRVNTAPMKRTDNERARRNNMKNAFQLRSDDVKYRSIIIVDDIYTSGSTIDAVAREFRKAGVCGIYFVTVAASHL